MNWYTNNTRRNQPMIPAVMLLFAALSGCGPEPQSSGVATGNAQVSLNIAMPHNVAAVSTPQTSFWAKVQEWVFITEAWAATVNEITALAMQVTGPGIPTPLTNRIPISGAASGQVISVPIDVPVGTDRVFIVSAVNGANRTIFQGQSAPLTLIAGHAVTANVQLADTTIQIVTTVLPDGTGDLVYTSTMAAEQASGAVTWTVQNDGLPPGLALDGRTGVISGTPRTAGVFPITVRATDSSAFFDEQLLSITINPAPVPPRIVTTSLPGGTVGSPYTARVEATGGTGASTWSVVAGTPPPGLQLVPSTGAIAGTPNTAGAFNFTVLATDTLGRTASRPMAIIIGAQLGPPTITTTSLPDGFVETDPIDVGRLKHPYNATLVATGGTGAVTWSVVAGTPPQGLELISSTGTIVGDPITEGMRDFTIRVTDTAGQSDSRGISITIRRTSSFFGTVINANTSAPISNATITVTEASAVTGTSPQGNTDTQGNFRVSGVPEGLITFTVSASGFTSQTLPGQVHSGRSANAGTIRLVPN